MKKEYREVTEKKLERLVSEDGMYTRCVYGVEEDSDRYQEIVKDVKKYEESALGTVCAEVMAIPHAMYDCDAYQAASFLLDATNCCEDKCYVFHIRTVRDIELIFQWGCLVSKDKPSVGKRLLEQKFNQDGTPRDRPYLTRYSDDHGHYNCARFDPEYFVDKDVVVTQNCDNDWMIIQGTVDDIEADRKELHKRVIAEIKEQMK